MADTEKKAPKAPKAPKGPKAEQGAGAKQQAKGGDKGGDKAQPKAEAAAQPKAKRPEQRVIPRLRTYFDETVRKQMIEQHGYKNPMQVPTIQKVVINMGIGEGVNDRKKVDFGGGRSRPDCRPEGGGHQGAQIDRHLQAARWPGDRLQGHAAQVADV